MNTERQRLDKGFRQAYDYIANVIFTQKRVLFLEDMYYGYSSMGFKPELTKKLFEDYYYQVLIEWVLEGKLTLDNRAQAKHL